MNESHYYGNKYAAHYRSRSLFTWFSGLVVAVLIGLSSLATAQVRLAPDSLSTAQDIVEVRAWILQLRMRLQAYKGAAEVGEWPAPTDLDALLALGNEIVASEEVDWRTLSLITEALIMLTPQGEAVAQFADRVVGASLPAEVRQEEFSTIGKAMLVIARQGDSVSVPLFLKYERPDFWAGRSRRMVIPSSANPSGEADAHLRLREAAVRALAGHADIETATAELAKLEVLRSNEPAMLSRIQDVRTVIQERRNPPEESPGGEVIE